MNNNYVEIPWRNFLGLIFSRPWNFTTRNRKMILKDPEQNGTQAINQKIPQPKLKSQPHLRRVSVIRPLLLGAWCTECQSAHRMCYPCDYTVHVHVHVY